MESVIVELCDFLPQERSLITNNLVRLKEKLRTPLEIPFSLEMNSIYEFTKEGLNLDSFSCCYDVEILHNRNLILIGNEKYICVYDYTTRKFVNSIILERADVHEMIADETFLYVTTGSTCTKYKLDSLLKGSSKISPVWSNGCGSNTWGISLFEYGSEKYVFAMDYGEGLKAFNAKDGKQADMVLPSIQTGYGVTFTEDHEMIITTSNSDVGPVQIYTFNPEKKDWTLSRQAKRGASDNTPYGVCYEKRSGLIYVVDTTGCLISVFRKEDLSRVKSLPNVGSCYGITLDKKKGELYVPCSSYSINIYR